MQAVQAQRNSSSEFQLFRQGWSGTWRLEQLHGVENEKESERS